MLTETSESLRRSSNVVNLRELLEAGQTPELELVSPAKAESEGNGHPQGPGQLRAGSGEGQAGLYV